MFTEISLENIHRVWQDIKRGAIDECWPWQGTTSHGYGEISIDYVKYKVHRLVWILTHGILPDGIIIMHSCDNPSCCNPNHLTAGTSADNSLDMVIKGRSKKGTKHHNAKLTDDDVRAIRVSTDPQWYIAQAYGLKQSSVSRIKSRKAWPHVRD